MAWRRQDIHRGKHMILILATCLPFHHELNQDLLHVSWRLSLLKSFGLKETYYSCVLLNQPFQISMNKLILGKMKLVSDCIKLIIKACQWPILPKTHQIAHRSLVCGLKPFSKPLGVLLPSGFKTTPHFLYCNVLIPRLLVQVYTRHSHLLVF